MRWKPRSQKALHNFSQDLARDYNLYRLKGMEIISLQQLLQLVLALALVVALMGGLAYLLKRLGLGTVSPTVPKAKKRLKIVESQPLDARRRLVILQCDDKQHLVILGQNGETVIQRDIAAWEYNVHEQQESPSHA